MTGQQARPPIVLRPGEGESVELLGNRITITVPGTATGDAFSVIVYEAAAGFAGPPLHRHAFDELFYVLDGTVRFKAGAEALEAAPGTTVFVPGGVPHTFATTAAGPATLLITMAPAGFEEFFVDGAERLRGILDPAAARTVLGELNHVYGVEVVSPTL